MRRLATAMVLVAIVAATAAARGEDSRALEDLVIARTQTYLAKRQVLRPAYYARLLHSEVRDPWMRRAFTVKLVRESRGRTNAVSRCGCVGPWQVKPAHLRRMKIPYQSWTDPRENLRAALKVFEMHRAEARGDRWKAIYRYSGGSRTYVTYVRREMELI